MKKFYSFVLGISTFLMAGAQPMTGLWTKYADVDFAWFTSNNALRGIAYNKATNHLLVSELNNNIHILDADNGTLLGTLSRTGLGTEGNKHIRIRVTDDGVIYGISLYTGPYPGNCIIYRWANESANPTIAATFEVRQRTGDALGISGTGNNTIIYASGGGVTSGNTHEIYMLTTPNGSQFVRESIITVPSGTQQWANRTIDPVTNSRTSDLWIKTSSGAARRLTVGENNGGTRTGTLAYSIPSEIPIGGYSGVKHFVTSNGKKFLAFAASVNSSFSNPQNAFMRVYDVSNESNVIFYGIDSLYNDPANEVKTNGNGTGDIVVKEEASGEFTIFWLATNNGIKATRTGSSILPVNLVSFNAGMINKAARLTWKTAAENNNLGFDIERSANGVDFQKIGFVGSLAPDGNSKLPLDYSYSDHSVAGGRNFYRLKQVDRNGISTYSMVRSVDKENNLPFSVTVRNNPVFDQISLSVQSVQQTGLNVALVNASGAVLQNVAKEIMPGETIINMPANQLPKGVYFVTVRESNNAGLPVTIKVIK